MGESSDPGTSTRSNVVLTFLWAPELGFLLAHRIPSALCQAQWGSGLGHLSPVTLGWIGVPGARGLGVLRSKKIGAVLRASCQLGALLPSESVLGIRQGPGNHHCSDTN